MEFLCDVFLFLYFHKYSLYVWNVGSLFWFLIENGTFLPISMGVWSHTGIFYKYSAAVYNILTYCTLYCTVPKAYIFHSVYFWQRCSAHVLGWVYGLSFWFLLFFYFYVSLVNVLRYSLKMVSNTIEEMRNGKWYLLNTWFLFLYTRFWIVIMVLTISDLWTGILMKFWW